MTDDDFVYKRHDNVLIRGRGEFGIRTEIWDPRKKVWFPFPKTEDIRHSSIAAWFEGTPVDEKDVPDEAKGG